MPVQRSGQGSDTQSTSRQVGSAFGIAIFGTILFSVPGSQLNTGLSDQGVPEAQRAPLVATVKSSPGAVIPGWSRQPAIAEVARLAKDALTIATRDAAFTAAGFLLVGLVATASLGTGRQEDAPLTHTSPKRRSPASEPVWRRAISTRWTAEPHLSGLWKGSKPPLNLKPKLHGL